MVKNDKKAAAKGKDKDRDKRKRKAPGKAEANPEPAAGDTPSAAAEPHAADAGPPTRDKSEAAFAKAKRLMPGGVSSPVRAYNAVGGTPVFLKSAAGPRVTDLDGNTYIDYVGSYGPAILGHAPDHVVAAVTKAASHGTSFGAPTEAENRLAELVIDAVPSIEVVRFVNSGTEAAMSAIRLARAATGRAKIIKCTGCYHGHTDSLLVQAGSGATTLGLENTAPASGGVPPELIKHTLLVPYNDLEAAKKLFEDHPGEIGRASCRERV
jgi:glutamate-1-semialdehyde 2,1-aminomutase